MTAALEATYDVAHPVAPTEPPLPATVTEEPRKRYRVTVLFKSGARELFEVDDFTVNYDGATLTGYKFTGATPAYHPLFLNVDDISAVFCAEVGA